MAHVIPQYSKGDINRAGEILKADAPYWIDGQLDRDAFVEATWAQAVLANFRGAHTYPINTFQALLRQKLRRLDADAIVAQRLKRTPSIKLKLQRFEGMRLARMQDIGGLRAILSSMTKVRNLEQEYRETRFAHQLVSSKNYIANPKSDGYRGIHLIYRYANETAPAYSGLSIELQFRTRLQHAWATAVETMGTFLGQALKSGQGELPWRQFFTLASAALSAVERTAPVPGYESSSVDQVCRDLATAENELRVIEKLRGFAIAANQIKSDTGSGTYHLIVLDSDSKSVNITPFPVARLEEATSEYARYETLTREGRNIEAVLVSAGPIGNLRKAYPNYFLDTAAFIRQIERLIEPHRSRRPGARRKTGSVL